MDEGKRKIRIQKYLSQAGVASRREAEGWIREGRVTIKRGGSIHRIPAKIGESLNPEEDEIFIDENKVQRRERHVYYLFHKPKNVMVTRKDPEGRPTIYDYLKKIPERVNYVGRLDFDSEGLILLTNDGELHHRLTHPGSKVAKRYRVKIERSDREINEVVGQLSAGIDIGGYVTAPCKVEIIKKDPDGMWVEMTLTEGKQRQLRRMWEAVGFRVLRLIRVAIGPLKLGDLARGTCRRLTEQEIREIEATRM